MRDTVDDYLKYNKMISVLSKTLLIISLLAIGSCIVYGTSIISLVIVPICILNILIIGLNLGGGI